jgi:hypothetical protein
MKFRITKNEKKSQLTSNRETVEVISDKWEFHFLRITDYTSTELTSLTPPVKLEAEKPCSGGSTRVCPIMVAALRPTSSKRP